MFLILAVTLYTSRVILQALGIEDYGLYNVIGGIIAMFGLLNSSMATATQRFLTFETGKGNMQRMRTVFGVSISIHLIIAGIIALLGETVGLWFFYNKLTIPEARLEAGMWVYQMSVFSAVTMIVSVPYNAVIIAHERMSAFAYISILDVALRLLSVYVLFVIDYDRLKVYAVLMFLTQITLRLIYGRYCTKHFKETHTSLSMEPKLFRQMLSFAGWSIFGNAAVLFQSQGLNILLNIFFSPAINAARAIAVQVQYGVNQFSVNLQSAINPQITKSYALGDLDFMSGLVYRSSKFSFLLLWIIILPVILNTDFILELWLNIVPEYSDVFVRIMLVTILLEALSNPFIVAVSATGRIREYGIVVSSIIMATLPVSWICLHCGASPASVFYITLVFSAFALFVRFYYAWHYQLVNVKDYISKVILKILPTCVLSGFICWGISFLLPSSVWISLSSCMLYPIIAAIITLTLGLDSKERAFVFLKFSDIIHKITK